MATHVLIVDDDAKLVSLLARGLAFDGFDVGTAPDGPAALSALEANPPDVVLLDIGMPGPDGFDVCRAIRAVSDIPIIMLTARDEVADVVRALRLGADDYIVKPFAFEELAARIEAVGRRSDGGTPVQVGDLTVDLDGHEVSRGGRRVALTATEYQLLATLAQHRSHVLSRRQLLESVWGFMDAPAENALEVHIGRLRRKLEAGGGSRLVHTVRGAGYVLRAAPA